MANLNPMFNDSPRCVRSKFIIYPDVTVTINLGDRGCLMRALTLRQCDADRRDAGRILFAIRMYLYTRQTEHDCPAQYGGGRWIAATVRRMAWRRS